MSSKSKNQISNLYVQENLDNLLSKANQILSFLDEHSALIKNLEYHLNESKLLFPFLYLTETGDNSIPKAAQPHHKEFTILDVMAHITRIDWYLSWEHDEISKKYRLCLISKEEELLWIGDAEGNREFIKFRSTPTFKKPLIETPLATRLQHCKHINRFIVALKNHLEECHIALKSGANPFIF